MNSQATTANPAKRGRPAKAELRQHLLDHTLKVLLRDGYAKFSMNAVARSAASSKESLYRQFGDKAGLLSAALDQLGDTVKPLLLSDIRADMPVRDRLLMLAGNYLQGCLLPESLSLQRIAYADDNNGLGLIFAKKFTRNSLTVMTEQFQQLGTPSPEKDAEVFLAMVQGQIHENALLGVADTNPSQKQQEIIIHAVNIFMRYLHSTE